jgi:hypothetical protein
MVIVCDLASSSGFSTPHLNTAVAPNIDFAFWNPFSFSGGSLTLQELRDNVVADFDATVDATTGDTFVYVASGLSRQVVPLKVTSAFTTPITEYPSIVIDNSQILNNITVDPQNSNRIFVQSPATVSTITLPSQPPAGAVQQTAA